MLNHQCHFKILLLKKYLRRAIISKRNKLKVYLLKKYQRKAASTILTFEFNILKKAVSNKD